MPENPASDKLIKHESNLKKFFNQSAEKQEGYYDVSNSFAFRAQEWARKKILAMLDFSPKAVLDAGSGRGDFCSILAQKFPKSNVIGVDFSRDMVKISKQKTSHLQNISFKQADITRLPFKNNQFELTICLNTIHHLLRGQGFRLALSELTRVTSKTLFIEIKNKNNLYMPLKKIKELLHTKGSLTNFTTPNEIKNILSQYNFKLEKKSNVFNFAFLSPIIVLKFIKQNR